MRLADGRVSVASIGVGSGRIILQAKWTSDAPVVDFFCRDDGSITMLLPDGRVVVRHSGLRGDLSAEKPYDDFTEDRKGFVAKGGSWLAEVASRDWILVCVTGGGGPVQCPRDMKAIYGDMEAFGPIRRLYAQGRAALLEDGRFVLGGPQIRNYPGTNPVLLDRVVRVAIADLGFNHIVGCLLRDDASVWCFGPNEFGQLGDGTRERHDKPVRVVGLPRIVDVSTSGQHACAIDENGGVWCWGRSKDGETGEAGQDETEGVEVCPVDEVATEEERKWAETHPPCTPRPPSSTYPPIDDPCGRLQWTPEKARAYVRPKYKNVPGCVLPDDVREGHPRPVRIDEVEDAVAIEAMPGRTWAVRRDGVIVAFGADALNGKARMQPFPLKPGDEGKGMQ